MKEAASTTRLFGQNVFNDAVMCERLPKKMYDELKKSLDRGEELSPAVAEAIAGAMRDWAIERGATHYTHWFQPLTGVTAEKHDSFLHPLPDGKAAMDFSGKELIKGEPDASSFPSGGLRATFEARGYSVWDCTSPAFLREGAGGVTLVIPTAFCAYTGEALDKKTPLLRSMEVLSREALRIERLFGNSAAKRVIPSVGPEQEYFLIDRDLYLKRKDLFFTGRTLFGAMPPKGQEMEDHYFGSIKERVGAYMKDLNEELWKMGVSAKTQHNEVAPAQHELATVYATANIASDHNQLVMDTMKKVALRHGLVCLLHEKPFAGVNGSGKHNNWSLITDEGKNLLDPGKNPHENLEFLLMLTAILKAVDDHADVLRFSAANPGNDHRLGANEAPPAIISVFLGEQLEDVVEQIVAGRLQHSKKGERMKIGVSTLPFIKKDATDRNRTSPFAFTGNKFEFRMVPSSASIAGPNCVLNTLVADALHGFADELEKADDFDGALKALITREITAHQRIVFGGNGYSEAWVEEARRRDLQNIDNMVDAVAAFSSRETVELFGKYGVLSEAEVRSRAEISYETYGKALAIEAHTMADMASRDILPAVISFISTLADSIGAVRRCSERADVSVQESLLIEASDLLKEAKEALSALLEVAEYAGRAPEGRLRAEAYRDRVLPAMAALRAPVDRLETLMPADVWPMPTYGDLLFKI